MPVQNEKKEAPIGGGLVFMSQEKLRESFTASSYPVLYPEFERRTFPVPAVDGLTITLTCFFPLGAEQERFPVILRRGNGRSQIEAEELARRGFVYIWAEPPVRTPNLEVQYTFWREDGIAVLNYLQEQPWVDRIGLRGGSAGALAWWCVADVLPEKVQSLYLTVYGTDRFAACYQDGMFRPDFCSAPVQPMPEDGPPPLNSPALVDALTHWPHVQADKDLGGKVVPWYRNMITSPEFEAPLWQKGFWKMLRDIPAKTAAHTLYMMEGWYDHHLHATLMGYPRFPKETREKMTFVIGPWNHFDQVAIYGHSNLKNADLDETAHALDWFEQTLMQQKPAPGGITYYMIGADEWRTAPDYPFPTEAERVLYLGSGTLKAAPGENGSRSYTYDPNHPVLSNGGEALLDHAGSMGGSRKQPEPNWRQDVVSFVSEPLEDAVEILGRIRVRLYVQSDARDTAFGFKLMEVFPNGEAYHIRNGMATLGYRNHAATRQSYNGEVVDLEIDSWDIAWQVQKGSRLRVDISSSNCPEYAVHPNTDRLWSEETAPVLAQQTLYFGADYPARVILPTAKVAGCQTGGEAASPSLRSQQVEG